jgi:hypothetical protein
MPDTETIPSEYARHCIPDARNALMPGDDIADVAKALIEVFPPSDTIGYNEAFIALCARLGGQA